MNIKIFTMPIRKSIQVTKKKTSYMLLYISVISTEVVNNLKNEDVSIVTAASGG